MLEIGHARVQDASKVTNANGNSHRALHNTMTACAQSPRRPHLKADTVHIRNSCGIHREALDVRRQPLGVGGRCQLVLIRH